MVPLSCLYFKYGASYGEEAIVVGAVVRQEIISQEIQHIASCRNTKYPFPFPFLMDLTEKIHHVNY